VALADAVVMIRTVAAIKAPATAAGRMALEIMAASFHELKAQGRMWPLLGSLAGWL
jgi:hypothetical protein